MDKPAIKGRGAADNPRGRFEELERDRDEDDHIESHPQTVITLQQARSIISRNDSPDLPFNQSINPYQGCEHGCIYCYARPSHAYLGLSPGLDFETKLFAKGNAAELLREEFRSLQVLKLRGSNHFPFLDQPNVFNRMLMDFLSSEGTPVEIKAEWRRRVSQLEFM